MPLNGGCNCKAANSMARSTQLIPRNQFQFVAQIDQTHFIASKLVTLWHFYINNTKSNDLGFKLQPEWIASCFSAHKSSGRKALLSHDFFNRRSTGITIETSQEKAASFPAALPSLWVWPHLVGKPGGELVTVNSNTWKWNGISLFQNELVKDRVFTARGQPNGCGHNDFNHA